MTFDWTTFALQLVNVLILLAILRHFLFRPVAGIIAKRQKATEEAMDRAKAAEAAAKAAQAQARAEAEATASARHEAMAKAQAEAEGARAQMIDKARTEAAQIVARGKAERAAQDGASAAAALGRARDLAGTIAARALAAQPRDLAGYAGQLAAALGEMPQDERAALLGGGDLRLVSAVDLSPEDLEAARAALADYDIDPQPKTDPDLIAGLELHSNAGAIRNSLAHDLEVISAALAKEAANA